MLIGIFGNITVDCGESIFYLGLQLKIAKDK